MFIRYDRTTFQPNDALCSYSELRIMCYNNQRSAGFFIKIEKKVHYFLTCFCIEIAGRFIRK